MPRAVAITYVMAMSSNRPYLAYMAPKTTNENFSCQRSSHERESLQARRAKRADEAVSAMAEYEHNQRATLERTAKLRAERLAQQAESVEKKSARKTNAS
jgi:hypothetical protein